MRKLVSVAFAILLSLVVSSNQLNISSATAEDFGSSTVSAGQAFTCDITISGIARCWGANAAGQDSVPVNLGKITQISAGGFHACAVTDSGGVRCWGSNSQGQSTVPADLERVIQISSGYEHTCVVTISETVRCWGSNSDGQVTVPSFLGKVAQVSAGLYHTCTVSTTGIGECWGNFRDGQTNVPFDIGKISSISAGWYHTCAITNQNQLRCWGWNQDGQITIPTGISSWSQVSSGFGNTCAISSEHDAFCWGSSAEPQSMVPNDLGKVSQISAGSSHTCALTDSGIVRCWGSNNFGQLMVPLTITPRPTISGNAIVGGSVTAQTGTWESGVNFTFQWLRDGVAIQNANSASYLPQEVDFNTQLTVSVTGSKSGYSPVNVLSPPVEVGPGNFSDIGIPTVVGEKSLGGSLSASPGSWDSGTNFTYQWLRDGLNIKAATSNLYTLSAGDLGKNISVLVTGSKTGYITTARESSTLLVTHVSTTGTPCSAISSQSKIPIDNSSWKNTSGQPSITGPVRFGSTAQASAGIWSNSAKLCTYWLSGDQIVPKVTATSYKVSSSDIAKELRIVAISLAKTGQLSARYSDPVLVAKATFAKPKSPVVKGLAKVGLKLTGSVATWESSTSYSYQWLKDSSPISSANSSNYTPTPSDLGSSITLKVCGIKQFFSETCLSSVPQTVALGTISPAGKAGITGSSVKVGAKLTGTSSAWMNGVSLKFQWLLNGVPISGAVGNQRIVQQTDKGKTLTFQVTAEAEGYQKVISISKGTKIP